MYVNKIVVGRYELPLVGQAVYEEKKEWTTGQEVITRNLTAKVKKCLVTDWNGFPKFKPKDSLGLPPYFVEKNSIILYLSDGGTRIFYKEGNFPIPLLGITEKRGKVGEENYLELSASLTFLGGRGDTKLHFQLDGDNRSVTFANVTRIDIPTRTIVNVQGISHVAYTRERPKYVARGVFLKEELPLLRSLIVAAAVAYSPSGGGDNTINAIVTEAKVEEPSQAHLAATAEVTFESKRVIEKFYSPVGEITIPPPSPLEPPPPAPDPFGPKIPQEDDRLFDLTFDNTFN